MTPNDAASKIGLFIVSASLEHIHYSLQRGEVVFPLGLADYAVCHISSSLEHIKTHSS